MWGSWCVSVLTDSSGTAPPKYRSFCTKHAQDIKGLDSQNHAQASTSHFSYSRLANAKHFLYTHTVHLDCDAQRRFETSCVFAASGKVNNILGRGIYISYVSVNNTINNKRVFSSHASAATDRPSWLSLSYAFQLNPAAFTTTFDPFIRLSALPRNTKCP